MSAAPTRFPDPRRAPGDAPLAVGGDLEPATLLDAYAHGIFPWPAGDGLRYWWSPDPRAVFDVGGVHVSRSLRKVLRQERFTVSADQAFVDVVRGCAERPGEGTWITLDMIRAYRRLHRLGHAHSVEVWQGGALAGGIYGVAIGGMFCGESMFHRVPDASKVALVALDRRLADRGYVLFDAQLPTPHLHRMGAYAMPRARYLARLADAVRLPVTFGPPDCSGTAALAVPPED